VVYFQPSIVILLYTQLEPGTVFRIPSYTYLGMRPVVGTQYFYRTDFCARCRDGNNRRQHHNGPRPMIDLQRCRVRRLCIILFYSIVSNRSAWALVEHVGSVGAVDFLFRLCTVCFLLLLLLFANRENVEVPIIYTSDRWKCTWPKLTNGPSARPHRGGRVGGEHTRRCAASATIIG